MRKAGLGDPDAERALRTNSAWRTWSSRAAASFRFGLLAYAGAAISLGVCFWNSTFDLVAPVLGLTFIEINRHVQAVIMCVFAAVAVALFFDRKQHGESAPFLIGAAALIVIVGTLYTFYDSAILASGYVLLLIAAFLNQNRMLSFLSPAARGSIRSAALAGLRCRSETGPLLPAAHVAGCEAPA